jgi:hypothetical protein
VSRCDILRPTEELKWPNALLRAKAMANAIKLTLDNARRVSARKQEVPLPSPELLQNDNITANSRRLCTYLAIAFSFPVLQAATTFKEVPKFRRTF